VELKLYNRLKRELLGDLAAAAEHNEANYQGVVERYAFQTETGIPRPYSLAIQGWLGAYNLLVPRPVRLRYYQILALYFTEAVLRKVRAREEGYTERHMLAYWMATGSGKTLLMHLNILQFIDHIGGLRAFDELQIILTTPGVNLIEQHRREVVPLIEKLNQQCAGRIRLTIDSTQSLLNREKNYFDLPDHSRVFRLVLVDEGHIGLASSGQELGKFKELRHNLADYPNAFLFEYSATYHGIAERHVQEYEDQIVYDFNYYRFFKDGYGKDFHVSRVADDEFAAGRECWDNFSTAFRTLADKLTVYQELRINLATGVEGLPFTGTFPDKPLLAFMGRTVEDSKDEGKSDEVSDIRKLLGFLARMPHEEKERLKAMFNGQIAGSLTLTRCPAMVDEILLSWGDGEFWGIINVGNGDKFFNDSKGHPDLKGADGTPLVHLRKSQIVETRYHFINIDSAQSPVNVLIGSRKFAEGWNCFRVSVIGLINLGSTKGNKIIQIFGRGVRLKGLKNDGKRHAPEHNEHYDSLVTVDSPLNRLRRLETLNIFSLKKSYLDTFLKALEDDLPTYVLERSIQVSPAAVWVGGRLKKGKTVPFESYRDKLGIFKVGRQENEPALIAVLLKSGRWAWRYLTDAVEMQGEIPPFVISLDYRADSELSPVRIEAELYRVLLEQDTFLPMVEIGRRMARTMEARSLQLYRESEAGLQFFKAPDLLELTGTVTYHAHLDEREWLTVERLLFQAVQDVLEKIHHKLIYDINKRQYRYDRPKSHAETGGKGDFIDGYTATIEFASQEKKEAFETEYPDGIPEQLKLSFNDPRLVYQPLLRAGNDSDKRELSWKQINISPDSLNPGERKFVSDLHDYLNNPVNRGAYDKHEFYLLRNVESLRSAGVYLENETRAFFPDFILWVIHKDWTHILLIDPKGQTGITDWVKLEENEKVKVAHSGHLKELARKLTDINKRPFKVDSFILLRDSSPLGTLVSLMPTPEEEKNIERLQAKHVLRLDWHERDEAGNKKANYWNGRTYLDVMFSVIGR